MHENVVSYWPEVFVFPGWLAVRDGNFDKAAVFYFRATKVARSKMKRAFYFSLVVAGCSPFAIQVFFAEQVSL